MLDVTNWASKVKALLACGSSLGLSSDLNLDSGAQAVDSINEA